MGKSRYSRQIAALAAALLVALLPAGASARPDSGPKVAPHARKGLSNRAKLRIRRMLQRELRQSPGAILRPGFLKQADLINFRLPLTVRLDTPNGQGGYLPSDDVLQIDYDTSTTPWPLAGGQPPASQTTHLSGTFTMEASFGGDASGYGELGALETVQGAGIVMKADPFRISDFNPVCGSGPQLATDPANQVVIASAGARYGLLNPFSQQFRGTLNLRMTFASQLEATCGGAPSLTPTVDNSTAPPMPLAMNGRFYVSPAITADGKVRFGKIVVDDSVTAQTSNFAYVRACTGNPCNPMQFPARIKLKYMTADVLVGDIRG